MSRRIAAGELKAWLSDGGEIALLDVREAGEFGESHLFFAIPAAYSRFEAVLPSLVPNRKTRIVLCDGGNGIAERAARRAETMGYGAVHILDGGIAGWAAAGYTLFAGVNVPSKTFGELVELAQHTPRVTAAELQRMREEGRDMVIVDGRTVAEFRRMSIPGGISCPNGELALHIDEIAPDPATTIVVNCAGRTRSIIGAQTLIDIGVANPVVALENGTQGWFLAGLKLDNGSTALHAAPVEKPDLAARQARSRALAVRRGVTFVAPETARGWLDDDSRTTYLLDVRTAEEYAASRVAGFVHAPGGQLVQATDQWVAVRGARLVLLDAEGVRAPVTAGWLRQLGYEASVLDGGVAAAAGLDWRRVGEVMLPTPVLATITPREVQAMGAARTILDIRPSMTYRQGHLANAVWSIRPRIVEAAATAGSGRPVILVADDAVSAALAAADLAEAGIVDVRLLDGAMQTWAAAGLPVVQSPDQPADADCIDFLFFTHARHDGNAEAARQYLSWEIGLVDQLDEQERSAFRVVGGH